VLPPGEKFSENECWRHLSARTDGGLVVADSSSDANESPSTFEGAEAWLGRFAESKQVAFERELI
jgi:hypothetical protein